MTNLNENTIFENLWDEAKQLGQFIAIQAYLKKQEESQTKKI